MFSFVLLYLFHVLLWVFVMLAGLSSHTPLVLANVCFIAFVYLVHAALPMHVLEEGKRSLIPDDCVRKEKQATLDRWFVAPHYFVKLQNFFARHSFQSPLSPQGMLILGLLVTFSSLYYRGKIC
jgi:hypothetical protein